MGHDFHLDENTESSGGGTDINAPINSPDEDAVEDAIKRYVKLIPANRIILSIPFYARWWKLQDRNRTEIGAPYISGHQGLKEGIPAYYEVQQLLNINFMKIKHQQPLIFSIVNTSMIHPGQSFVRR